MIGDEWANLPKSKLTDQMRTENGLMLLFSFSLLSRASTAACLRSLSASLAFFFVSLAAYVGLNLSPRQTRMLAFKYY